MRIIPNNEDTLSFNFLRHKFQFQFLEGTKRPEYFTEGVSSCIITVTSFKSIQGEYALKIRLITQAESLQEIEIW